MMAEKFTQPTVGTQSSRQRSRDSWVSRASTACGGMSLVHRFVARKAMQIPDPVLLAVLAIDRVGPGTVRACASGVEVRVTASDEATARILRAALAQTASRRGTDRLIRIVVD